MQVFFLYYFRSILLFINTLIASAYIELTLFMESAAPPPRCPAVVIIDVHVR